MSGLHPATNQRGIIHEKSNRCNAVAFFMYYFSIIYYKLEEGGGVGYLVAKFTILPDAQLKS